MRRFLRTGLPAWYSAGDVLMLSEERLHWLLRGFDLARMQGHPSLEYVALAYRPEHYELAGSVFLQTLQHFFAADFTPGLEQAWRHAFVLIAGVLLHSSEEPKRA